MEVKDRVAELEAITVKMRALAEGGLDDDKRPEYDRLAAEAKRLAAEIETAQKDEERKRDLERLTNFLERPAARMPFAAADGEADPDGVRKALSRAGWECKGGVLMAPVSSGGTVPMWPEQVLFGEMPDDAPTARFYRSVRAIFNPLYPQAYVKFARYAARYGDAMALSKLSPDEQKALSEGSDPGGGFLVPPDTMAELLARKAQQAVVRRYARVVTTTRDAIKWPRLQAHSTSGSIYSSGFVGDWVGETPAFTDTDPAFGEFEIGIKKLRVATKVSNDLLADAAFNVLAVLAQEGAQNMALVEDNGFITGAGTPLQPQGILNGGAPTVDVEGTTADTISNTTANLGSAAKLLDLIYALPPQYRTGAVFLMHPQTELKVRKLVDAQNRFLYSGAGAPAFGERPGALTIEGFPVENSSFMPQDGTNGNKVIVFGQLGNYVIADRAQVSTVVLRERFADVDQVGIIMFERVGGALANEDAIRIGVV